MSKHVIVIGAGIVGLSTADALLDRGFRVTVLERESAQTLGCSFGNGGLIVPSHFVPLAAPGMVAMGIRMMLDRGSPFGVEKIAHLPTLAWMARFALAGTKAHVERCSPLLRDLNLASKEIYTRLISEMGVDVGYGRRGLIMLSRTHEAHESEAKLAAQANKIGLKATVLDEADLKKREPDVEMSVSGGVLFEDDAHLSPDRFMFALRERIKARGAEFRTEAEVKGLEKSGSKVRAVKLASGELVADEFVLAAGAWSTELAAGIGHHLPMLAGRGYGLTATKPPQRPNIPTILTEARIAVTPVVDGLRFVGTMELTEPRLAASSPRVDKMRENITKYYPAFRVSDLQEPVWCGLRPCSPDGMPYIGRSSRAENLVVATGHAMMGMSLGPVTGRIVSDLLAGDTSPFALDLVSPNRYV